MTNRHLLVKFWKCQNVVTILPHEAKALLDYFPFSQLYLAKGKIAPVVTLKIPYFASADQDWVRLMIFKIFVNQD